MKYIFLIFICFLLLGASGDSSRRPLGLVERDYQLLADVIKAYKEASKQPGVSAWDLPKPVNFKLLSELLEKLANEPEFPERLARILKNIQGKEGHQFFAVVRDALDEAKSENRELFMQAIKSSDGLLAGLKHYIPYSWCAYWGFKKKHPHNEEFALHVCQFGTTRLQEDLNWLEQKVKNIRVGLLNHEKATKEEIADVQHNVPGWLRNPEKYQREIAMFKLLEPAAPFNAELQSEFSPRAELPEIIGVMIKYARHLAGQSGAVNEVELAQIIKNFILDKENGVMAILHYAQE